MTTIQGQTVKVNQADLKPTTKMKAVGTAGVVITALVFVLAQFGVIVPDGLSQQATEAVAATIFIVSFVQAIIQFAAGYFKKTKIGG